MALTIWLDGSAKARPNLAGAKMRFCRFTDIVVEQLVNGTRSPTIRE